MNSSKAPVKSSRPVLTASIASFLALVGSAEAQQTWTGTTSTDWNLAENWSGGAVPAGVNAFINSVPTNIATISGDLVATPVDILVGSGAGNTGRLDHTAGTAGTGNNNWMFVGTEGGTGTYNLADTSTAGGTLTGFGLGSGSLNVGGPSTTAGRLYVGGREIGTGGTGAVNINTSGTVKIGNDLVVGSRGGTGVFKLDAGTVTTNGWNFFGTHNGLDGGNGTFQMSGGSLTNLNSRTYVGLGNSTGSMVISGGTYNNTGTSNDTQFAIGVNNNANASTASVTMTGGTINANRLFAIGGTEGFGGNGGSTGAGKGAFTMSGESALLNVTGELWVGNAAGSVGTMDVSAGTVKVNNWVAVGRNASNGTLTLSGTGRIEKTGNGNFEVGGGAGGVGVLNLDGGTLNTHNITRNGAGSGTVNFNGGLLQANQSNAAFMQDLSSAFVKAGGAKIDTQAFDITIAQSLLADAISTGGGLTKLGAGQLVLASANTYTGQTLVSDGTLALSDTGSINDSSGIVINGDNAKLLVRSFVVVTPTVTITKGTLDGIGSLTSVTIGDGTGGKITNGNGTATTLTMTSLTFNGAANFTALVDSPLTPALSVSSLLVGAVNPAGLVTVDAVPSSGIWINGQSYPLINYSSIGAIGLAGFQKGVITGLSSRQTANLTNSGSAIALDIIGDYPIWSGAVDGRWTTATIAPPKNWNLQSAGTATDFIAGDTVIFNDSAAGTTVLNISDANVNITSAAFENNSLEYTITSAGGFGIAGGAIIKSGTGTVTITTANTYSGGTTLNSGVVNINNAAALGVGPITFAGGSFDNTSGGAIALAANNTQRWTNNLTFLGSNPLNLGTGAITLGTDAADQTITLANNSGLAGASLIIGGDVTSASGGNAGIKTLAVTGTGNTVFGGNITRGAANGIVLQSNLSGTLTLSGSANAITTLHLNGGANSVVDLGNGNLTAANGGGDIVQSTTGGTLAASAGGSLIIGSANGDFGTAAGTMLTIAAQLAGTAAVDFYSPNGPLGTIVLAAANPHTGGTNVENTRVVVPAGGAINATNAANSGQLNVGTFNGGQAILELNGGTINATKTAGASAVVGNSDGSVGAFRMTEGFFNTTSEFWVGSAAGGYGAFSMSGGVVNVGNWLPVGRNGSGYMEMSGGVLNVTGNNFTSGSFAGNNGTLSSSFGIVNLQGGTLNITNTGENQGGLIVAESGIADLNVDGDAQVNISGARGLHLATNASGVGVVNLNGGTVTTPRVQMGAGIGTLNFDGGTLRASAENSSFLQGLTNAYVREGGAIIDDGGFNITVGQNLQAPTGSGVSAITVNGGSGYLGAPLVQITGDGTGATAVANIDASGNLVGITVTNPGVNYTTATVNLIGGGGFGAMTGSVELAQNISGGFVKRGTGTTTLSGVNTYTGPTVIEQGRLAVTGSITGSELIDVGIGAIFDGSGVSGGFVLANGQTIAGDGNIAGAFTMGAGSKLQPGHGPGILVFESNLDISAAAAAAATGALLFELGPVNGSDRITMGTGTLSIGGGVLAFDDFAFTALPGLSNGVYTLFDGIAPINGTLDASNLSGVIGAGFSGTLGFSETGDDLILTVVPEPGSALILLAGATVLAGTRRPRRRS